MNGETDLEKLLKTMRPKLNAGAYVFCTVNSLKGLDPEKLVGIFKEEEGYTVIVERGIADGLNLKYSYVSAWITLAVHSSLAAVGLTAAVSAALANGAVSCNVVAAYYHDHIFVDYQQGEQAVGILKKLSGS